MFADIRRDIARLADEGKTWRWRDLISACFFDNGFQAVVFYRVARWFKARRVPFFGPWFSRLGLFFTGVEIGASAEIGPGLRIAHGNGVVIGGFARVGANALVLQQVTLGAPTESRRKEMPTVGDNVILGAGAKLIGAISVGDGAVIGVNAVVTRDVPAGGRVGAGEAWTKLSPPA